MALVLLDLVEPQLDRAARARREMEIELAEALVNGEFRLHYQPIIDLGTGRVAALSRGRCGGGGRRR